MILGFGNNIVSALAGDITTVQTDIPVMPGTGAKFAKLLSADFENKSNTQRVYAKITLTDKKESAFEICHLVSVSGDVLNVIRGHRRTMPPDWKQQTRHLSANCLLHWLTHHRKYWTR